MFTKGVKHHNIHVQRLFAFVDIQSERMYRAVSWQAQVRTRESDFMYDIGSTVNEMQCSWIAKWHAFYEASFFGLHFSPKSSRDIFTVSTTEFSLSISHVIKTNHINIKIASLLTGDHIRCGSVMLCQTHLLLRSNDRLTIIWKKSQISSSTFYETRFGRYFSVCVFPFVLDQSFYLLCTLNVVNLL